MSLKLFGVLGWPVGHSASPAMMNAAFAAMSLDAQYVRFPVPPARLGDAVRGLVALGMHGANVTIPHKQAVAEWVSDLSAEAKLAGAVNTLRINPETGAVGGHNTDIVGWWTSIHQHVGTSSPVVTVLGAGGAARAIVSALALYAPSARVSIVARRPEQTAEFQSSFGHLLQLADVPWHARHDAIHAADLVVNTTPLGMWPNVAASPVADAGCFRRDQVVQDIVYRPLRTAFLDQAAGAGATALDGLWMLVYQGAAAIDYWLGALPPASVMRAAAEAFLQAESAE